jgi:hypothetical protein
VLVEVQGSTTSMPLLKVDNKSANKEFGTPRTEYMHIEVKYLLVWEFIENDLIKVEFIRNEEQMGDILTKPLDRVKFLEVHDKISLIDVDVHNKA